MKKGIVMELYGGKATVLAAGGLFHTVEAEPGWQKGDVVTFPDAALPNRSNPQKTFFGALPSRSKTQKSLRTAFSAGPKTRKTLTAAAACFAAVTVLSLFGRSLYLSPEALISLDVNPSIELTVNRFDRVIGFTAYNEEGKAILNQSDVKNRRVDSAVQTLLTGELEDYLEKSPYLVFSVQSDSPAYEEELLSRLRETVDACSALPDASLSSAGLDAAYYPVDETTVLHAHDNHVTAGKYMTLMELKSVMPDMELTEYSHCGVGEIQEQIRHCESAHSGQPHRGRGKHDGHGGAANGRNPQDGDVSETTPESGGSDNGSSDNGSSDNGGGDNGGGDNGGRRHGRHDKHAENGQPGGGADSRGSCK